MPEQSPRRVRSGNAEREAALAILQQAFVVGRLRPDELSQRQDQVLASRYLDELDPLIADLPEARQYPERLAAVTRRTWVPQPSPEVRPDAIVAAKAGMSFSIMSSRSYDLVPGQTLVRNFAWWGGDIMDVRDVMGPGRVVVLELYSFMGGHTIYVPEGVRVLDESRGLLAGNDIEWGAQGDGSNGTLVLRGTQWWSGSAIRQGPRPHRDTRARR